ADLQVPRAAIAQNRRWDRLCLRLRRRLRPTQRAVVLDHALERFPREIEAIERRVAPLQQRDDPERLFVVIEATVPRHAVVERLLAGVTEWRVPQVVREGDRLREILIESERARDRPGDLRDLNAVREAGPVVIALVVDEHLGLV